MSFLSIKFRIVALVIGLSFLGSFTTLAAQPSSRETCVGGFASLGSQAKWRGLELPQRRAKSDEKWALFFGKIRTYDQWVNQTTRLEHEAARLTPGDIAALHRIDLIQVAEAMSPSDRAKLRAFVRSVSTRTPLYGPNRKASPIALLIQSLQFYFEPESVFKFMKAIPGMSTDGTRLQGAFAGEEGLFSVNETMASALERLPPEISVRLRTEIKKSFSSIDLKNELMSMDGEELYVPNVRTYRRNLEVMAALVGRKERESLAAALSRARDRHEILEALDTYYSSVSQMLGSNRGHYSVKKVLRVAETLRAQMGGFLDGEKKFVDLYGSFANGKAAFATSDVDLHFSAKLLSEVTGMSSRELAAQPFSLFFSDFVEREGARLSPKFAKFWKAYRDAEEAIGDQAFQRKPEKASDLMTTLIPPVPYRVDAEDSRWYNPIVFRVYRDKVVLQVNDLMSNPPRVLEVVIP